MNDTLFNSWNPIDSIVISPEVASIHCDTRDFHCILNDTPLDLRDGRYPQITKCLHKKEYLIHAEDIVPFLKKLKDLSGGDGEWRMLDFKNVECGGWLKYIRIYRVPSKDLFIVCNRDGKPILYNNCTEDNLITEYLNLIDE